MPEPITRKVMVINFRPPKVIPAEWPLADELIPQYIQTGDAVPVLLTVGSGISQLGVTIAVR